MSIADKQYLSIVEHILDHGYYADNRTGVPAYKLPHQMMQFDLSEEFPILTTKFVAFKTAVKELLWIWQLQSNDVRELQKMNCHVWDEWSRPHASIHPTRAHSFLAICVRHWTAFAKSKVILLQPF